MKEIDVKKLMEEAKILYWHEGNTNYQKDTVGIPVNLKNTENLDEPAVIEL